MEQGTRTFTTATPVAEFVVADPSTSRIFESLGIDYCCGGKKPLSEACAAAGASAEETLARLLEAPATASEEPDWAAMPLTELADRIEATHHVYLRRELPRLAGLVSKVARVHGERHAELNEVNDVYFSLVDELGPHMEKEERILFPMIRAMEAGERGGFHCGSVGNPIRQMEHEHDRAGDALARLRALTRGYDAPEDACNTYRAMLQGLEELEGDLHAHVHKENNILFPRAAALETQG